MKEETRKVQLTGGSTLTVSLPIKWAREAGIKQGDEISLIQRSDKSLVLTPTKKEGWKFKSAELELSTAECFEDNFRYLIAYYLVGYDLVRLLTPSGFKAEERKRIKEEVRKRLIGMEVVGESSREIVLQSFLKYEDFTLRDAISTLENRDPKLAEDVAERDNEVDRFYLLIVRQLKAAMSDPELAKKIGVGRQRDSLGYRIVVKSMERIGDHVENIARNSLFPSSLSVSSLKVLEGVKEAGSRAERLFAKTLSSLSEIDLSQREAMKTANETIRDANALVAELERLNERVLAETEEELSVTDKIQVLSILDSLGRIAKYCTDIAEVTINMSTKIAWEWAF